MFPLGGSIARWINGISWCSSFHSSSCSAGPRSQGILRLKKVPPDSDGHNTTVPFCLRRCRGAALVPGEIAISPKCLACHKRMFWFGHIWRIFQQWTYQIILPVFVIINLSFMYIALEIQLSVVEPRSLRETIGRGKPAEKCSFLCWADVEVSVATSAVLAWLRRCWHW